MGANQPSANLALFYLLICCVGDFDRRNLTQVAALGLGMLAIGLLCARHFARFHRGNEPHRR